MVTRRRGREVALQLLFQFEESQHPPEKVVDLYAKSFSEGGAPDEFSVSLFKRVAENIEATDKVLVASSENWRLDRMSRVDRNILRIGVCEITQDQDVPARVAINEAVELAKRFSTTESAAFVNGVLDRVARDQGKL